MPSEREVVAFVAAFASHWQGRDGFQRIMHPGATLWVAGARAPYAYEEAERFVTSVKQAIPDLVRGLRRAHRVPAARGDAVFTEWEMSGTLAGRSATWRGINRNTLDGARSRGAVSCWDRHALLEQVRPDCEPLDLGAELARLRS